ncbi:diacylglycerol kinase1 [Prunus dulcis]|uniref:Diacylglycerol kinase1 n=1 Tax=Prunus dulcis TaxID=3755 RepID=A0A4Y1RXV5_PRUDU|nr:diacylglycerol kinase1 [Prunus dulcis]
MYHKNILEPTIYVYVWHIVSSGCGVQAFMLKRADEEPLGHAAATITDVVENAETNHVISDVQKRALLQEMKYSLGCLDTLFGNATQALCVEG